MKKVYFRCLRAAIIDLPLRLEVPEALAPDGSPVRPTARNAGRTEALGERSVKYVTDRTDAEVPAEARGVCDHDPRAIKMFLETPPRNGNN